MYNTSVEDVLEVPEARMTILKLSQEFYPQDNIAQLVIRGNASASAYQSVRARHGNFVYHDEYCGVTRANTNREAKM